MSWYWVRKRLINAVRMGLQREWVCRENGSAERMGLQREFCRDPNCLLSACSQGGEISWAACSLHTDVCVRKSVDWSIWTNQRGLNVTAPRIGPLRSGYGLTSCRTRNEMEESNGQWRISNEAFWGSRQVFSVLEFYLLQGVLWGFVSLQTVYMPKNLHNTQGDG